MAGSARNLYDAGWRQGSHILASLPCSHVAVDDGNIISFSEHFDEWILVTQDCDLHSTSVDSNFLVEFRPVVLEPGYIQTGIRSAKFAITDGKILHAQSTRVMVEARVLTRFLNMRRPLMSAVRRQHLKKWLGLRYDRPAIPAELVPIAKAVSEAIKKVREHEIDILVRDVLMDLDIQDGPTANLYAVIRDPAHRSTVEEWLELVGPRMKAGVGRLLDKRALTEKEVSLDLLESTYPADLSQITINADLAESRIEQSIN